MSEISSGDTVYIVNTYCSAAYEKPVAFIDRAVVDAIVPGYGVIRKIGDRPLPAIQKDVFSSEKEAAAEAARRIRDSLGRITVAYEAKIKELESLSA